MITRTADEMSSLVYISEMYFYRKITRNCIKRSVRILCHNFLMLANLLLSELLQLLQLLELF